MYHMVVVLACPARNQTRTLRTRNMLGNGKIEHGSPKKGRGKVNTGKSCLPMSRRSITWHRASGIHRPFRATPECQ